MATDETLIRRAVKPIELLFIIFFVIVWCLVLPFYFNGGSTLVCSNKATSCSGYDMTSVRTGAWHWLGGYHLFVQRFLPASLTQRQIYRATYNYSSDWLVLLFVAVCLLLGYATYSIFGYVRRAKI